MAPPAPANIRVLVRVRPLNKSELTERGTIGKTNVLNLDTSANSTIDFNGENKENGATISLTNMNDFNRRMTTSGYNSDVDVYNNGYGVPSKQYTFDVVHGEKSTQSEVYGSVKGIVDAVVGGYNGTIVAYGQTGSGKTHTVFGSGVSGNEEGAGLLQRALRDIFDKIAIAKAEEVTAEFDDNSDEIQKQNSKTTFKGSFFEIFNERVYDLLSSDSLEKALPVREDSNGVYVEGLKEDEVRDMHDAECLLAKGLANRHVASTNMNRTSSRSHALFVLSVKTEHTTPDGLRKIRNSKFTLVDLAGSERQKSTAAIGNRLKEASMINKSLLCLGHVINALVDKEHGKARHVPFRNSKLTFLLKDTWGGNSKTCLVATVSPSAASSGETASTLTFAQRAKLIKNNAVLNENTCGTVEALQAEVAKLRSKLQESSSIVVEKIVGGNINSDGTEMITSLKRRNERAELRIAELEKQASDEAELTSTLKRKIQEETLVRKLKERRLEYLQRKNADFNRDEQIEVLKTEIQELQKRLDAPSQDAIEWRVAYEETKEALEKKMEQEDVDSSELEETNRQLEDTVDRLCTEKLELETKISELTESSKETRKEIESIMDEVDTLEKEMVSCQKQLLLKDEQFRQHEKRADDAELKLQELMDSRSDAKQQLENQITELQAKVTAYSQKISELTETLEKKDADLMLMETLVKENQKELQHAIDGLKKELDESNGNLSEKNKIIKDLDQRLTSVSEENHSLSDQVKSAVSEVEDQKIAISAMEEKIRILSQEKEDVVQAALEERGRNDADWTNKINSLQEKVEELTQGNVNLESRLSCVKQQAELSSGEIEAKQAEIQNLQEQIKFISEAHEHAKELLKTEKSGLDKHIREAQDRIETLTAKIAKLEADREANLIATEDEKILMAQNLTNEIDGLKNQLVSYAENNEFLKKNQQLFSAKENELKDIVKCLMCAINEVEVQLQSLKNDQSAERKATSMERENYEKKAQEQLIALRTERDELLEEVYEINEELNKMGDENVDLTEEIHCRDSKINSLQRQISEAEDLKKDSLKKLLDERDMLGRDIAHLTTAQLKLENELNGKDAEIKKLSDELSSQSNLLDSAYKKVQESLEVQEALRMSQNNATMAHSVKIRHLTDEKETLVNELVQSRKEIKQLSRTEKQRKQELTDVQKAADKYETEAKDLASKISLIKEQLETLGKEHHSILRSKDVEVGKIEMRLHSVETDCASLRKQNESALAFVDEMKEKYDLLRDRFTLLQREKGNLEFELDTMQEDQNALSAQNTELRSENEKLKKMIDDFKVSHGQGMKSENNSCSGTTWNSDPRLSYDTLAIGMDSMIAKINKSDVQKSKLPDIEPAAEDAVAGEQESDVDDLDDSFDESMFLPNIEDEVKPDSTEGSEKENIEVFKEEKPVGIVVKPSSSPYCSTPSKTGDYGKRRVPLSDRKNNTPLPSQSKRLRSSTKKIMSSKKSRTNYMLIDNRRLFN